MLNVKELNNFPLRSKTIMDPLATSIEHCIQSSSKDIQARKKQNMNLEKAEDLIYKNAKQSKVVIEVVSSAMLQTTRLITKTQYI